MKFESQKIKISIHWKGLSAAGKTSCFSGIYCFVYFLKCFQNESGNLIYFCKKKNQVFLHSCKDFFLISYSDMRIMNAIVVLTCITLRANEHLLICLFVIFISSSVKCLVISFEHFLIGLLCLWDWLTWV